MRGSFFGLNVSVQGLYTSQRSLDVVNHNLANVNTPGYSRQESVQRAATPAQTSDHTGMVGTGSETVAVSRIRDVYLDYKYWSENVTSGEWSAKEEILSDLEATFNEPSDSGFTTVMNNFFSSMQELAKDPSSSATRALVKQNGVTLAKYFNSASAHLEKLQGDINYRIKTKTEEINSLASQISQLNRQVYAYEINGDTANDLRDQRGVLVDKLSKIINLDANEVVTGTLPNGKQDKHFVITVSGKALVDHYDVAKLAITQRDTKMNGEDIPGLYDVNWADGNKLSVRGGELKGYLDTRDGNDTANGSPAYKGVPFYQKKLNQFVQRFAMAFNEGFVDKNTDGVIDPTEDGTGMADGYGMDPDGAGPLGPQKGIRFFTVSGTGGKAQSSSEFLSGVTTVSDIQNTYQSQMTAKNFSVSEDVLDNYLNIATSSDPNKVGNIDALNAVLALRHTGNMFSEGAPEDFMKSMITTLGIDSQQATMVRENQESMVKQIENRRMSNSGVSIDEEMASIVKFQHAYNANAKMIQTMQEVYETLINKLGVG